MRPQITLEVKKSHASGEGYIAHLVVGTARIWIDKPLCTINDANDLHTNLAKEFSTCGIDLVWRV